MNIPRINIYTKTERVITDTSYLWLPEDKKIIYKPPREETIIISNLVNAGYTPFIDGFEKIDERFIRAMYGILFIIEENRFILSKDYESGTVFAAVWYQEPVSVRELEYCANHFSPFFGSRYKTVLHTRLLDGFISRGGISPQPRQYPTNGDDKLEAMDISY